MYRTVVLVRPRQQLEGSAVRREVGDPINPDPGARATTASTITQRRERYRRDRDLRAGALVRGIAGVGVLVARASVDVALRDVHHCHDAQILVAVARASDQRLTERRLPPAVVMDEHASCPVGARAAETIRVAHRRRRPTSAASTTTITAHLIAQPQAADAAARARPVSATPLRRPASPPRPAVCRPGAQT